MDTLRPLPARELRLPGESLTSLVRRTTGAMGYDNIARIRSLLRETGELPACFNHLQTGPVWSRLETLLRQSTQSIAQGTVHHYAQRLMLVAGADPAAQWCDSKAVLKYFQSAHPPVCPLCLADDEQAFERLAWSLRALPVCLRHRRYLTARCPNCNRSLRPDRLCVSRCRCGFDIRTVRPERMSESATRLFDRIAKWFDGKALPLNPIRSCATLWWLDRLVSAIKKTPDWLKQAADAFAVPQMTPSDAAPWLAAADIIGNWPQKLFVFLDDFQHVAKHRTTATGLTRSFGLLLREAQYLEDIGYSLPADTLRRYLADQYTAGHLTTKACLFAAAEHQKLLRE